MKQYLIIVLIIMASLNAVLWFDLWKHGQKIKRDAAKVVEAAFDKKKQSVVQEVNSKWDKIMDSTDVKKEGIEIAKSVG